jgi:hypothetical protein
VKCCGEEITIVPRLAIIVLYFFVDIISHQQKKDGMRQNIYRIWLLHWALRVTYGIINYWKIWTCMC